MAASNQIVRPTFELAAFDYTVIAQQIKESRDIDAKGRQDAKQQGKPLYTSPNVSHLSNSITGVRLTDTLEGSSTLEVTIADPEFELFEFFDIDKDGKLDKIELQYPPGSANWWRLTGLGISTAAGQALQLTLTFMERPAVLLLHKRGPKKTSRGKVTRAQFLQSCVQDVKKHPLKFKSMELKVKQDVAGTKPVDDSPSLRSGGGPLGTGVPWPDTTPAPKKIEPKERKENKHNGLHKGDDLTVKGAKANPTQMEQGERLMDTAYKLNAPHDAVVALLMTAIAESNMGQNMTNMAGSKYGGVLAGSPENFPDQGDTEAMAKACLRGGKGFNCPEGGLIGGVKAMKSKDNTDSYDSLGHLCYVNQGNLSNFAGNHRKAEAFFGDHESEAEQWVEAYGDGFSGGSTYYRAQYNFQIGTEENPKERYWDGMRSLADEVRWRLFIDGRTVYFDSDMTLIRQKPAAVIHRWDPAVIGFDASWDGERDLATEMQLELICNPFQFRAGEVFKLVGFGPLSNGSTALPKGLPGRWLIWEIDRSSSSYSSSFILRQPERERMEPNAGRVERDDSAGPSGGSLRDVDDTMTPKDIIEEFVLPLARKANMVTGKTPAMVEAANGRHGPTVSGGTSDHQGPPSVAWATDMSNGSSPTPQMDGLADELARKFGFEVSHSHVYAFPQVNRQGLRFQLGYRTNVGGNHFNHVHFGCRVTDPSKRKSSPETPGAPGYSKGGGPD